MRILYVEDNPVDIDLLKRHFKKAAPDIAVDAVRTQKEALSILRGPKFSGYDLVLTDMRLPDGDGIAILSYIRSHSLPLAVVVLTGQGDEETAVSVLKSGADDYVSKRKGYLERLPALLKHALKFHQNGVAKRSKKIHALYLEHNPADIDLTCRHFERYAAHIILETIKHADQLYTFIADRDKRKTIDVMLLDYRLPGANAVEIYKKLKFDASWEVPTILISGKGDEEIATNALKLGIFDYVSKNQGYLFKLPTIIENAYYSFYFQREHELLRKSEAKLRYILDSLPDMVLEVDPELNILWANKKALNLNPEAIGQTCYSAFAGNDTICEDCSCAKSFQTGRIESGVMHQPFSKTAGESYWENFGVPLKGDDGHVNTVLEVSRDVTEREFSRKRELELQAKLFQSQRMDSIGNLAAGVAHDFNNILSSIIGFTELALDDVNKDTTIEDNLHEVYEAGKRAKDLVKQILTFAMQSQEKPKPIQVNSIIEEALQFIRSSIPTTIETAKEIESDAMIMGDATQVHQIIMNLCTNAAHAMEEKGGSLKVTLKDIFVDRTERWNSLGLAPGGYIELNVSDTGVGIPPDIIGSIFEPYFTTKESGEGTGMGLAVIHGIIESYNGKITVESQLGKGTRFIVYLPTIERRKKERISKTVGIPTGTERILFVDDEVSIAKMGSQILERLGYSVKTRTSSVEALELFQTKPNDFDLVVTDMTMPNMTGDKLAIELMKIRPDIPVILCTGYSKKISDASANEIGIKAFAYKPVVKADLAKTVRKVLDEAKN